MYNNLSAERSAAAFPWLKPGIISHLPWRITALCFWHGESFPSYFSLLQPWKLDHTGLVTPTFAVNPHGFVTHSPSPTSDGVTSSFLMTVEKDLCVLILETNRKENKFSVLDCSHFMFRTKGSALFVCAWVCVRCICLNV